MRLYLLYDVYRVVGKLLMDIIIELLTLINRVNNSIQVFLILVFFNLGDDQR